MVENGKSNKLGPGVIPQESSDQLNKDSNPSSFQHHHSQQQQQMTPDA
jgi:hypothetical protein